MNDKLPHYDWREQVERLLLLVLAMVFFTVVCVFLMAVVSTTPRSQFRAMDRHASAYYERMSDGGFNDPANW